MASKVRKAPSSRSGMAEQMLDAALRRYRLSAALRPICDRHPAARSLLQRMAFYFTPDLPHPGGVPLLDIVIRTAIAYHNDMLTRAGHRDTRALYLEFVAGAFTPLPSVVEIDVHDPHETWDALANPPNGSPLGQWIQGRPNVVMSPGSIVDNLRNKRPREIRSTLASYLLMPVDLAALPEGAMHTIVDYGNR